MYERCSRKRQNILSNPRISDIISVMKIAIACFSLLLTGIAAFGQVPQERQILVTPNAEHPQIAKDSGLGGPVRVAVTVDQSGNVVSVGEATGPGNVCPSVTRVDVLALRESARAAATNAKFAPSADPNATVVYLNFEFPSPSRLPTPMDDVSYTGPIRKDEPSGAKPAGTEDRYTIKGDSRFTVKGDRDYTAGNTPPPDYTGPAVSTSNSGTSSAGARSSIPSQISGGVLNGKAVSLPKPPYPPAARAVRASGAVSIQVLIDEDGQIFSAMAVSGHPLLRAAARNAACGAQFTPTLLVGNPVKVSGVITYNFVP